MLASLIYLIAITVDIVKSPLHEALKDKPELMKVKIESRKTRRKLFLISSVLALIIVIILRPFKIDNSSCNNFLKNSMINDVSDIKITNN